MSGFGVTDARTALMREAENRGELDPAIAAVLDQHEPEWRIDPLDTAWDDTFNDYRVWERQARRAPEAQDQGAAGLRPWLERQAKDPGLSRARRRKLETLRGWSAGVDGIDQMEAWPLVIALHRQGVRPHRPADRKVAAWLVAERLGAAGEPETPAVGLRTAHAPHLLSLALFCARNGRFPTPSEPNGRWLNQLRRAERVEPELRHALTALGRWKNQPARRTRGVAA